ncbi:YHS domain-containing (seleno)protein [Yoonia sp. BS5-3]|uniref:YHS domain-containing (Seleno)protein n=1 Tax=Yoonia phaeophyticola TaxID=3137369 RepID=A0ABZ2V2K7_9RHOB
MITRRHILATLTATAFAGPALAGPSRIFAKSGLAICGYDPVAYFRDAEPALGASAYRIGWRRAVWQFASAENLALFERDPHAYAPRYGGYCAMALSRGEVAYSDPEMWAIHDGRLYLTHSATVREQWLDDPDQHIADADLHWPALLLG